MNTEANGEVKLDFYVYLFLFFRGITHQTDVFLKNCSRSK